MGSVSVVVGWGWEHTEDVDHERTGRIGRWKFSGDGLRHGGL